MEDQKPVALQPEKKPSDILRKVFRPMYIVPVAVALVTLGWAYFDKFTRDQDDQMARLNVGIQQLADQQSGPFAAKIDEMAASGAVSVSTYAAALGEHRFQVDLPETHHLFGAEDPLTSIYIATKPTPENELPVMAASITIVNLEDEPYASMLGKDEPRSRLVATPDGKLGFLIRVWEDFEWPGFEAVAASFKAL